MSKQKTKLKINELVISREDFINAIPGFVNEYYRLPYMEEDKIETTMVAEDGVTHNQTWVASKYIKAYFKTKDQLTQYLFNEGIISYESVGNYIGIEAGRLERLLNTKPKNVTRKERRMIELFFGEDIYNDGTVEYAKLCSTCKNKEQCGQFYWVGAMSCSKYKRD